MLGHENYLLKEDQDIYNVIFEDWDLTAPWCICQDAGCLVWLPRR